MTYHSSSVIGKNIRLIAMVVFLHQAGFGSVFPLPAMETTLVGQTVAGAAWAAEGDAGNPETTPPPEGDRKPTETPPDSTDQSSPESAGEGTKGPDELEMKRSFFDVLHRMISQRLLSSATWLDSFFGDERYLVEQNQSYLRLRYDVFQEEKADTLYRPTVDLRLVLPQLKKKTNLVFSAEPMETPLDAGTAATTPGDRVATSQERNLTTALQYFARATRRESFIVRAGVQVSDMKPVLFVAPRYRSLIPLNAWDFRFTQEVRYSTKSRWQADTILDVERPLGPGFFFRSTLQGLWFSSTNGYFYNFILSLRHALDATHALDYEWIHSFQTRPVNELAEIALRVRYRQTFFRDWLYFEVAPQIRLPRTADFDILPGILLRIEAYFGKI